MNKRQIIRCPNCEELGEKQNLAEVLPSGMISIQRIRKGSRDDFKRYKNHTIIDGKNITISCGGCGHKVFIREKHD